MLSPEILKKIKYLEIYVRRILSGSLIGDSRSALKGSGLEFDQIREYQVGDDVRFIDWKSSSRSNKILVKQYIEERNRTILIAVDVSASGFFSSGKSLKYDLYAQVASILALVGQYGKDGVGLLLFSDHIEKYIPPSSARLHAQKIMEALFTHTPQSPRTDLSVVFEFVAQLKRKDTIVCVISDFISADFSKSLAIACASKEVIALRCLDKNEYNLAPVGLLPMRDVETNEFVVVDTRKAKLSTADGYLHKRIFDQNNLFKKYKIDYLDIVTDHDYMGSLVRFFRRQMRY